MVSKVEILQDAHTKYTVGTDTQLSFAERSLSVHCRLGLATVKWVVERTVPKKECIAEDADADQKPKTDRTRKPKENFMRRYLVQQKRPEHTFILFLYYNVFCFPRFSTMTQNDCQTIFYHIMDFCVHPESKDCH